MAGYHSFPLTLFTGVVVTVMEDGAFIPVAYVVALKFEVPYKRHESYTTTRTVPVPRVIFEICVDHPSL